MSTPHVVGLDLSLTSTGYAGPGGTGRIRSAVNGHPRLAFLLDRIGEITAPAELVVVEGPSYGSKGATYHQLAGLWWLVAHDLWTAGLPYAVVSPQARAKYATGRGNANKDAVLLAVERRFPWAAVSGNDQADALVLMAMGLDRLGHPLADLPAVNRTALDKVAWPEPRPSTEGAA